MKHLRDLKDLTIHDVKIMSDGWSREVEKLRADLEHSRAEAAHLKLGQV